MAQNNLAVLKSELKDFILSEEALLANGELREHIFEIKDAEKSLGCISLSDLKAYLQEHHDDPEYQEEAKNYWIKNIDNENWKNIYELQFFQRRKPQLVPTKNSQDSLDDSEFFILQQGQKSGPFLKQQLMDKIEKREILLSDMASYNGGHTWVKLFQIDGFDRRVLRDNDHLPGMPADEFLKRPSDSVHTISETTDAITSLAFLGNQKRGKTLEREREVSYVSYKDENEKGASALYKWLLVTSVIGIIFFLFNIKSHLSSPFGTPPTSPIGEQAEMLTPIENPAPFNKETNRPGQNRINDQRRMEKIETRTLKPIRPSARKSFMETKAFIESANDNGPAPTEDNNYYYDNAAPMELDPVRAQISKENFDNGGEPTPPPESESGFTGEVSN